MTSSLDSRKMSGLGINFSAREPSPLTSSGLWEDVRVIAALYPNAVPLIHVLILSMQEQYLCNAQSRAIAHPNKPEAVPVVREHAREPRGHT